MRPTCCLVFTANILAPENLEHLLLSTSPKPHPPIPQNQTKHKENTAWIAKIYEQSALPNVFTYSLKNTSKEGYSQGAKPSILSLPLALDNFLVLIKMGGGDSQEKAGMMKHRPCTDYTHLKKSMSELKSKV